MIRHLLARCCLLVCLSLLGAGCRQDPCATTTCVHGACNDGDCLCLNGYDGPTCSSISRARYLGDWTVGDLCGSSAVVYDCRIGAGGAIEAIVLDNLGDRGYPVNGFVQGVSLDIPLQAYGVWTIQGSGLLDTAARQLSLDYSIDFGGGSGAACLASFYPQ
jgi:hypothetical protein